MKAMVFAAGYGERLRPLTNDLPKALVPVAGRPMIEYPLALLERHGIREIVINLHYLGEKIAAHLGDGKKLGIEISYSREKKVLDTGGALLRARPLLEGETFIAINSDVLIDIDLDEVVRFHRAKRAAATLVLRRDSRADEYGPIETSADSRIRRFLGHEAPEGGAAAGLSKFMFTGVQVLEPDIFDHLDAAAPASGVFSTTGSAYPAMLIRGAPLYGFAFDGYWQDLGSAERIAEAEARLASGGVKLHYLKAGQRQ